MADELELNDAEIDFSDAEDFDPAAPLKTEEDDDEDDLTLEDQDEEDDEDDEEEADSALLKKRKAMDRFFTKKSQALAEKEKKLDALLAKAQGETSGAGEGEETLESYFGEADFTENEAALAQEVLEMRKMMRVMLGIVQPIHKERQDASARSAKFSEVRDAVGPAVKERLIDQALKMANGNPTKAAALILKAQHKPRKAPVTPGARSTGGDASDERELARRIQSAMGKSG